MKKIKAFVRRAQISWRAVHFGLCLVVCAGLFSASAKSQEQSRQKTVTTGAADADRAYSEVAAKNYPDAIEDFRKALAANPLNFQWRKDLGFACLAGGLPEDADTEFANVYVQHPEDLGLALQLGYLSQQLNRIQNARKYFERAARSADPEIFSPARKALANLTASQLSKRRQQGYDLIAQHRSDDAIKVFVAIHSDDPTDVNVTLQLGYLYAAAHRTRNAKEMFVAAGTGADPKIVAEANAGLASVERDTKLWFASFYAEPFYQSRFTNEINPATAKVGLNFSRYFQPYVGFRFNRDVRSQAGILPQIFSDNSTTVSIGVQSAIANTGIVIYAEAGTAFNIIGERPLASSDYRVGFDWFRGWGTGLQSRGNGRHSLSWTGSAYADGGFYSRYDHTWIGNAQLREGINLPTPRALPMQLLAGTNFIKDSNGNFYNNVVEFGPVLRIAPFRHVPSLSIEAQYWRGVYDTHDPTNPYGTRYGDFRLLLIWSKKF